MQEDAEASQPVVSTHTMEIAVAIIIMGFAALVMVSSYRLGAAWGSEGPESGYFPFYIGALMFLAGAGVLIRQTVGRSRVPAPDAVFVDRASLARVFWILIPTAIYTVLIAYIGIYVSSAIFIALFMIWFGRYRTILAVPIAVAIVVALFLTFEVWFLVPLPKGPLETWLGY